MIVSDYAARKNNTFNQCNYLNNFYKSLILLNIDVKRNDGVLLEQDSKASQKCCGNIGMDE